MNKFKIRADLKIFYEDCYEGGANELRWHRSLDVTQNIQTLCKDLNINSVIEIGAGDGAILKRLSDQKFAEEIYALEISSSAVKTILEAKIDCLKECTLYDGVYIPYENKKFDLAVLSHVLEHVEYPRILLYEAKRVAKYVFVQVPLEDSFKRPRDFTPNRAGHINFYSPRTIRWLIQTCGLRVIGQITSNLAKEFYKHDVRKKGLVKYFIKKYLLIIVPALATKLLVYNSALICEDTKKSVC